METLGLMTLPTIWVWVGNIFIVIGLGICIFSLKDEKKYAGLQFLSLHLAGIGGSLVLGCLSWHISIGTILLLLSLLYFSTSKKLPTQNHRKKSQLCRTLKCLSATFFLAFLGWASYCITLPSQVPFLFFSILGCFLLFTAAVCYLHVNGTNLKIIMTKAGLFLGPALLIGMLSKTPILSTSAVFLLLNSLLFGYYSIKSIFQTIKQKPVAYRLKLVAAGLSSVALLVILVQSAPTNPFLLLPLEVQ